MYPKLKVRSQDQDAKYGGGINPSLPGLKALNSLFHGDFSSPAKHESKPNSKKLEAEAPSPKNLGSITPLSASKYKNERGEEDIRPHIRASPIPRPRAVLSSPINDDMIGSNKAKRRTEERTSVLKPHQLVQKCNVTAKHSASGRPKSGHEVSKEATNKTEIHKPRQNVTLKHSAAERLRGVRETPEETDIRGNKGSVAMTIRVKE